MSDIDKISPEDISYASLKATLASVPFMGPMAYELFSLLVMPPIEKRKIEWMTQIGERLSHLEAEKKIDISSLSSNPFFIDITTQATSLALKTSNKIKLEAFKNAIINTATSPDINQTKRQVFLNLLDSFTEWHIKILDYINDPHEWYKKNSLTPHNSYSSSLANTFIEIFPELKNNEELLNLIWSDLKSAGLHRTSEINTMLTEDGVMQTRTTNLGRSFINFIMV